VLSNGTLTVTAAPGTVGGAAELSLLEVDSASVPAAPDGFRIEGSSFVLALTNLETGGQFAQPNSPVTIAYELVPPSVSDQDLTSGRATLAVWTGAGWVPLPCSASAGKLQCAASYFGLIALVAAPRTSAALDGPLDNGWFYKQANGFGGYGNAGFPVVDDADAAFWTEFQRLGGVEVLGYPNSKRFSFNGHITQSFQKAALQWQPELGIATVVDTLDELSSHGRDTWLDRAYALPAPAEDALHQLQSDQWQLLLDYYNGLGSPADELGAPVSAKSYGSFVTLRLQKGFLQLWTTDTAGTASPNVVVGNTGDVARAAGLWPAEATAPAALPVQGTSTPTEVADD
jgi:hypothetical protein